MSQTRSSRRAPEFEPPPELPPGRIDEVEPDVGGRTGSTNLNICISAHLPGSKMSASRECTSTERDTVFPSRCIAIENSARPPELLLTEPCTTHPRDRRGREGLVERFEEGSRAVPIGVGVQVVEAGVAQSIEQHCRAGRTRSA